MILPVVLFSFTGLVFLIFSYLIGKNSDRSGSDVNRVFVAFLRAFGLVILVVGNAYAVMSHKGWGHENVITFKLIAVVGISLGMALAGIRFIKNNRLGIARSGAMIWMLLWVAIGIYGYREVKNSDKGWTEPSQQNAINKCPSLKYERLCYLEQAMKIFKTPEEFNKKKGKQEEAFNKALEENCKLCDEEREQQNTETVDGLPDDW